MTDKFNVDPTEVDNFSASLKKLSQDNANAESYLEKWLAVDDGVFGDGGLFVVGANAVRDALDKLKPNFAALGRLTDAASVELSTVAQVYRTTDRTRAEEMDRTYPGGN